MTASASWSKAARPAVLGVFGLLAVVAGLVLYSLVWIALLLLLGWLGFRRKRFTRGAAR